MAQSAWRIHDVLCGMCSAIRSIFNACLKFESVYRDDKTFSASHFVYSRLTVNLAIIPLSFCFFKLRQALCATLHALCYSYRSASTGFDSAALITCTLTVSNAIRSANPPANKNMPQ